MSDSVICLLGWVIGLGFILAFILVWKVAFPSGEPGITERATAAFELYRQAQTPGQRLWAVCLGILVMVKGIKALLLSFFTFVISAMSASICGYDPFQLIERIIDFCERLLFDEHPSLSPTGHPVSASDG